MNGILILKGWMFASTQSWKTKLYYNLASIASVVHVLLEKKKLVYKRKSRHKISIEAL